MNRMSLALLTDFYELTMANGYLEHGLKNKQVYFDMFFRRIPDDGGFAIMAGVEQLIEFIENLKFTDEDIEYLRSKKIFSPDFLEYLKNFKFSCDIWAIPEGTPIFPNEPIITVRGPVIEAQFIETILLLTINHQSLIATKANSVRAAGPGRHGWLEKGSGYDGAFMEQELHILEVVSDQPVPFRQNLGSGTWNYGSSWVQCFVRWITSMKSIQDVVYCCGPYNTLESRFPNAIKVFNGLLYQKD